jgi:SAM-dependent methyltransferase
LNGAYKGRGRNYVALLTCPVDRAALRATAEGARCAADPAHEYTLDAGILRLVPPDRRAQFEAFSAAYDARCAALGWTSPDEDDFKSLPQTGLKGFSEDFWPQQAAATALLWRFLEAIRLEKGGLPVGPVGEAAVIGAGMGWLAYGLDVAGYATVALDARAGSRFGLGVYGIARYLRVQADPVDPPLAREAFDWIIFQEGLTPEAPEGAMEEDRPQSVLDRALRVVRPGGWVAVIDALARSEDDAAAVHTLFEDAGLVLVAPPQRPGWRGRLLELRDRIAGRDAGVPPVLVAQKPG